MDTNQSSNVDWNTFEGYLFDPNLATVEVVRIDKTNTLESICHHLGCDRVDVIDLEGKDCFYVDDEGWLDLQRAAVLIRSEDRVTYLGGKALLVRTDDEGNCISPIVPIGVAAKSFMAAQARLMSDITTTSAQGHEQFVISQELKVSPVIHEETFIVKA